MIDYAKVRNITGSLNQVQVSSIEAIQRAWEQYGDGDKQKLAYILASVWYESKFTPVSENLTYTSAQRICEVWPKRFSTIKDAAPYVKNAQKLANKVYGSRSDLGNDQPNDGWDYRGRGGIQITGKGMYAKFSKILGIDLVANPDFAKQIDTSAKIAVIGMVRGLFTGKKLIDYTGVNQKIDYVNARAIVNGDVKANGALIAGYARKFESAISSHDIVPPISEQKQEDKPVESFEEHISPSPKPSFLSTLINFIISIFTRKR